MSCLDRGGWPLGSVIALLVCWVGITVFCLKAYDGMDSIELLANDVFAFLRPWVGKVKLALLVLGGLMMATTFTMCLVGFFATRNLEYAYTGRPCSCLCSRLGGRVACALFWVLTYLLNICWLGILCIIVVLISVNLIFTPICLPQLGLESERCFNFSLVSLMMAGGNRNAAVSLILCGDPVSKFCKLTQLLAPWYWSAFFGCLAVLLGLSHFNGCLAANFAHVKHACRYQKILGCEKSSSNGRFVASIHEKSAYCKPDMTGRPDDEVTVLRLSAGQV